MNRFRFYWLISHFRCHTAYLNPTLIGPIIILEATAPWSSVKVICIYAWRRSRSIDLLTKYVSDSVID